MPSFFEARVVANVALSDTTCVLGLGDAAPLAGCQPGQFVMLRGDWGRDPLLPRAMSVLRVSPDGAAEILVKAAGRGTRLLHSVRVGERLTVLGPLGRGFPAPAAGRRDVLVAGGVGIAPLLMQAEAAAAAGRAGSVTLCYGGRTRSDLVLLDDLRRTGVELRLATDDGSEGHPGPVTELVDPAGSPTLMGCGPTAMLRALRDLALAHDLRCYLSLEETMACGIRACLGCAVPAREKPYLYACSDGPVFDAREVRW